MTEETISTTPEVSEEQTTLDAEPSPTQPQDGTIEDGQQLKPDESSTDGTEIKNEPVKNWEQIAKDNQASFTKVSQELAQLKKQLQAQREPQFVNDEGKIAPEFEQQYRLNIDNQEFLAYDALARRLPPETRAEVEKLLQQAQNLYNPKNKTAYDAKFLNSFFFLRCQIIIFKTAYIVFHVNACNKCIVF